MQTDDIFGRFAAAGNANLSLSLLPSEGANEAQLVLIQAPSQGLRLLGELLIAIADSDVERSRQASPDGAGSRHFAPSSEMGFYINRLDD